MDLYPLSPMNKSELIRSTPGTPTQIVQALAAQGVDVSLNLVKQVLKNRRRSKRKKELKYGKLSEEIRRLLALGLTPKQIAKRYWKINLNLAKVVAHNLKKPPKKRQYKPRTKRAPYERQIGWRDLASFVAKRYGWFTKNSAILQLDPIFEPHLLRAIEAFEYVKENGGTMRDAFKVIARMDAYYQVRHGTPMELPDNEEDDEQPESVSKSIVRQTKGGRVIRQGRKEDY